MESCDVSLVTCVVFSVSQPFLRWVLPAPPLPGQEAERASEGGPRPLAGAVGRVRENRSELLAGADGMVLTGGREGTVPRFRLLCLLHGAGFLELARERRREPSPHVEVAFVVAEPLVWFCSTAWTELPQFCARRWLGSGGGGVIRHGLHGRVQERARMTMGGSRTMANSVAPQAGHGGHMASGSGSSHFALFR